MQQMKSDILTTNLRPRDNKQEPEEIAYVRVDKDGKVIAIYSDDSEMDISELLTLSISDD